MRIQHNIMAMNAYRNYNTNNSALSKNLEKLSSGYKINRAGDDAAGLAISEKMRAQITGLEGAQKNAKDGISLVQTAEGALTEVHDMLNRMYSLAEQSANGTYDNETDRAQMQKEVEQLKTEIDRIADSSNFNGIKLLDGSMSASTVAKPFQFTADNVSGLVGGKSITITDAVKNEQTVTLTAGNSTSAGSGSMVVNYVDGNGDVQTVEVDIPDFTTAKNISINDIVGALNSNSQLSSLFNISADGTTGVKFETKQGGAISTVGNPGQANIKSISLNLTTADGKTITNAPSFADPTGGGGADAKANFDGTFTEGDYININGVKYTYSKNANGNDGATFGSYNALVVAASKNGITIGGTQDAATMKLSGSALNLQIGDTSDDYNHLKVSINDAHVKALGLSTLDISSQGGAKKSLDMIKDAINVVSDIRGTLGATQNRLDHTINNLSVMTENIQDAESTIRDTDVADEMMAYTKNNILVQSAQAMLAQANQVPQGVLQLLQ